MNKLKYILFTFIIVGLLSACEDKLNVENPNAQDSSSFWKTEDDIAEGVIAIYTKFLNDGSFMRGGAMLLDVRGDDVYGESPDLLWNNSGQFIDSFEGTSWPWRDYYMMIYRANLVLEKAEGVTFEDPAYKNRLLGQAYFLRGLAYYYITEYYCDAPLVLSVAANSDEYYPEQSTRAQIIAQVKTDLLTAMDMLPESYDNVTGADKGQTGRATWGAAAAFLARTYMMNYEWDNAETLLNTVIGKGIYSLVADYGDNFTEANENNAESVFEVQFGNFGTAANWVSESTTEWIQGSALPMGYGLNTDYAGVGYGGWSDAGCTRWIYDEYKKERCEDGTLDPRLYWSIVSIEDEYDTYTDGRSNIIYGDTLNLYTNTALRKEVISGTDTTYVDTFAIAKYTHARVPGWTEKEDAASLTSSGINYRVVRYAEILLNYAECLIVGGEHATAMTYVNMIRERAGLSILDAGTMTDDEIEIEYHHQRALELAIESIRGNDIRRWGWFYDIDKMEMLMARDFEFETWTQGYEYYQIWTSELAANPNLTGNSHNNATSNADDVAAAYDWASITE